MKCADCKWWIRIPDLFCAGQCKNPKSDITGVIVTTCDSGCGEFSEKETT